jgi:DNA repair protein RecO
VITRKVEAIVFKKRHLLGKDAITTLFTDTEGKIKVIAKGIKSITSRRAPHIQTGNLIEGLLQERGSGFYLNETKLISGFTSIKSSEPKTQFLYLYLFILDRMLPEHQQEMIVYQLLKNFIVELSKAKEFTKARLMDYLNDLLIEMGYASHATNLSELLTDIEEIIHEKIPVSVI